MQSPTFSVHELGQTLGDGEGPGKLWEMVRDPEAWNSESWGQGESDMTWRLNSNRSSPNQGNAHIAECCFLKSSDGLLGPIIQLHRDVQIKHVCLLHFFNKHSPHCNTRCRARIQNCTENENSCELVLSTFLKWPFFFFSKGHKNTVFLLMVFYWYPWDLNALLLFAFIQQMLHWTPSYHAFAR